MPEAAVTSKGQITIPVEIRQRIKLEPRNRVVFTLSPNGTTVMRAKDRSVDEIAGSRKQVGKKVSVRDLQRD